MSKRRLKSESHYLFWATYGIAVLACIILGSLVGVVFGYAINLPRVEELQRERSLVMLEVDQMIERSWVHLKGTITQLSLYIGMFVIAILSLAFFMGFLVGRAFRQKTR